MHMLKLVLLLIIPIFLMGTCANLSSYLAYGAENSNTLQVSVGAQGNFNIDSIAVHYTAGPDVKASFTINFNTSLETAPYINVSIPYDKSQYVSDKPVFGEAEVTIWGSTFENNGVSKDMTFSLDESYNVYINATIDNYPLGPSSGQIVCTYSFNLSNSIVDAKTKLAQLDQSNGTQSNMRGIINFEVSHLNQGISSNSQQKQLRFDLIIDSHIVNLCEFDLSIPDGYSFVGSQTLNGEDMYVTPNSVLGVATNNYGYDSQGNPFWANEVVVNWQTSVNPQIWDVHPYDWIIGGIIGVLVTLLLTPVILAAWNRIRKYKPNQYDENIEYIAN
jgi:hypothetical protein